MPFAYYAKLSAGRQRVYRKSDAIERLDLPAGVAAGARVACQGPDPLFLVEEALALLLDEHPAKEVAEQAHVGTESGIGRHETSLEVKGREAGS